MVQKIVGTLFIISLLLFSAEALGEVSRQIAVSSVVLDVPNSQSDPELSEQVKFIKDSIGIKGGDTYSLDKVQEAIRVLYEGDWFSQIRAYAEYSGDGVALRFEAIPKKRIIEIRYDGNEVFSESDLRLPARVRKGDTIYSADLADATIRIQEFYRRHGYPAANVTESETQSDQPYKSIVTFHILEGDPLPIRKIEFDGHTYLPAAWLKRKFALREKDLLDLDTIDEAIRSLRQIYREEGFDEVRIGLEGRNEPNWRETKLYQNGYVILHINSGPRIELRFAGNRHYSPSELRTAMKLDKEEIESYNFATLNRLKKRLVDFYEREGYMRARVIVRQKESKRKKSLTFQIHEGLRVKIEEINFVGADAFDQKELREELLGFVWDKLYPEEDNILNPVEPGTFKRFNYRSENRARQYGAWSDPAYARPEKLDPDEAYVADAFAEGIQALKLFYRQHGYLSARIEGPTRQFNRTGQRLTLTYRIEEGIQTRIRDIQIAGVNVRKSSQILAMADLEIGDPLNDTAFEEINHKLRLEYSKDGYIYALADISYTLSSDHSQADLLFVVREGPQVQVGEILVNGINVTKRKTVTRELTFEPGDVYRPDEMEDSQRWLQKLGIFQAATLKPWNEEKEEDVKKVVVSVIERNQGRFEVSGGIATDEGIRGGILFIYRNLFGSALEFRTRAKINHRIPALLDSQFAALYDKLDLIDALEREAAVGFYYPSILGSHIGVRSEVIHLRRQERAYGLDKNSLVLGFDTEIYRILTLTQLTEFAYLESARTILPSLDETEIIPPDGLRWEVSPKFQAVLDYRDSMFNPTKGFVVTGLFEYFETFAGDINTDLFRGSGSLAGYLPIPITRRPTVLRLTAKGGGISVIHGIESDVDKRFKLGGRTSLRGFGEEAVYPGDLTDQQVARIRREDIPSSGGDFFILLKGDLRVPLYKSWYAGAFIDSGNLWLDGNNIDLRLDNYKNAAGGGIHYRTPVGDLSAEVGWNLNPNEQLREDSWRFHFSISLF